MNKNRILLRDRYFESAIMICIANIDRKDCFILEKRAKNIRQAGEISFPGGKKDKKDKNFRETAIRETIEELQIKRNILTNIGKFGIFQSFAYLSGKLYSFTSNFAVLEISTSPLIALFFIKKSIGTTNNFSTSSLL